MPFELPDEDFFVDDDEAAIGLLTGLGLVHQFQSAALSTPGVKLVSHVRHPTHWVAGCQWFGNADPSENGFTVWCFRKSGMEGGEFRAFVELLRETYTDGGPPEGTTPQPGQN